MEVAEIYKRLFFEPKIENMTQEELTQIAKEMKIRMVRSREYDGGAFSTWLTLVLAELALKD